MQLQKPIGILGGTFDPIHFGHLRMALELHSALDLAKVHIIPCYQPVHREPPLANPQARVEMIKSAIIDEPAFQLDIREIKRQDRSYFIDTLLEMRNERPNTPLCIFIGLDAFLGFATWHRYTEILQNGHIIIAHRPQYQLPKTGIIAEMLNNILQHSINFVHENLAGGLLLNPITALEISASDIRKQIAMSQNPRYLLPNSVYDYIKQHGIYSSE